MFKPINQYFAATFLGALAFTLALDWSIWGELAASDWAGLGTFGALALLAQRLEVDSRLGATRAVKVTFTFIPLLALAVVMPAVIVAAAAAFVTIIHEIFFRSREFGRALFNTSAAALTYGASAVVYSFLLRIGGQPADLGSINSVAGLVIPFFGLAGTLFSLNLVLISIGLALRHSEQLHAVIREIGGRGGGNLLYGLLAAPVALFTAFLYETLYIGGLLLVILPLLLIRHTYLSTIQLQQANRDLLKVLVKTIETRDPYTSGHSLRVSQLARMVAFDMGLRPSLAADVKTAALLHDIGKIDVEYAEVISKPHDLSDEERRLIRTHATRGADLLQSLTSLDKSVIVGVRHHHEWYDGSGYPNGLVGEAIPLAARIIMICDAVDAMLSDRPYRPALPISTVRAELKRFASRQFDPNLVETILANRTLERAELLGDRGGARTGIRDVSREQVVAG